MSATQSPWLLKVIAGPHQGAEIDLAPGKSLIGSDEGCDVVLHDVLVAPQHLALDAGEKAVFVEPLGGRVYVGGRRVKEVRIKIDPFTFITLGGSHMVIGPMEGKWPLLSAGDVPELEKEPVEGEESAAGAKAASSGATAEPGPDNTDDDGKSLPPRKRAVALFGVAFGLILLTAWLVLFNIWKSNNFLARSGDGTDDLKHRAEEVLELHGAKSTVSVEMEGGRLYARGYVDSIDKLLNIEKDLRTKATGVMPRVWSQEAISESAKSILRLQRLPLDVATEEGGKLVITGTVDNRDHWNRVRQQLKDEIPGVTEVESKVVIPAISKPQPLEEKTVIITLPGDASRQVPGDGSEPGVSAVAESDAEWQTSPSGARGRVPAVQGTSPGGSSPRSLFGPQPRSAPSQGATVSSPLSSGPANPGRQPAIRPLFPTIDEPDAVVEVIQPRAGGLGSMRLSSGGIYFAGGRLPYGGTVTAVAEGEVTVLEDGVERMVQLGQQARLAADVPPAAVPAATPPVSPANTAVPPQGAAAGSVASSGPAETVLPALKVESENPKPADAERQKAIREALDAAVAASKAAPPPTRPDPQQASTSSTKKPDPAKP